MLKFGTDGLRGKVGESPLKRGAVLDIGYAIGCYFKSIGGSNVAVGRDPRESGCWIAAELMTGLVNAGCSVHDAGTTTTPMLAYGVKASGDLDGGVVVTASHNDARYNGVKIFDGNGEKLMPEEERRVEAFYENPIGRASEPGHLTSFDALAPYIAGLKKYFANDNLACYYVPVDSAEGAAYGLAKKVFECFGVEFLEIGAVPNGKNINESGALYPEALTTTLLDSLADLGVALDGDADRVVLVDETWRVWNGDRIVTMLAVWLRDLGWSSARKVVMTQYANGGAMEYLRKNGFDVETVLVGDREVHAKCRETGAELGGETAGHIIVPEWLSSSDGIFVALMVLQVMKKTGRKLSELWPDYEDMPSKQWVVVDPKGVSLDNVPGWIKAMSVETSLLGKGRVFVRRSGTEPDKIRLLVEASDANLCQEVGDRLSAWLSAALERYSQK